MIVEEEIKSAIAALEENVQKIGTGTPEISRFIEKITFLESEIVDLKNREKKAQEQRMLKIQTPSPPPAPTMPAPTS